MSRTSDGRKEPMKMHNSSLQWEVENCGECQESNRNRKKQNKKGKEVMSNARQEAKNL